MKALGEREPAIPVWKKWKKYTPAAIFSFSPSILYISVTQDIDSYTQTYAAHIDVYLLKSLCRCCSQVTVNADAAAVFTVTWLLSI